MEKTPGILTSDVTLRYSPLLVVHLEDIILHPLSYLLAVTYFLPPLLQCSLNLKVGSINVLFKNEPQTVTIFTP